MSEPKTVADRIYEAFLDAIQDAEEMGGPEIPQYIALMQKISEEAERRAYNGQFMWAGSALETTPIPKMKDSFPLPKRDHTA